MPVQEELLNAGGQRIVLAAGQRSDVVPVFLENVAREQVKWSFPGLPAYGDSHPTDPALHARQLTAVEASDRAGTEVKIRYTTADFIFHGVPPPDPGLAFQWEVTFKEEILEFPSAVRKTVIDVDGQQQEAWDFVVTPIREAREIVVVRWRLNQALDEGTMNTLLREFNKLHLIGGQFWLFKACTINIMAKNVYDFRGTWELDPGTAWGANIDPSSPLYQKVRYTADLLFTPGSPFSLDFQRPPWFQLMWVPPPAPANPNISVQPIELLLRQMYEVSGSGVANIPGWPF